MDLAVQRCQYGFYFLLDRVSVSVWIQEDLFKAEDGFDPVGILVCFQIMKEVFLGRPNLSGEVCCDEFHLLPHTTPNDRIVLVQADSQCFSVKNFLGDEFVDKSIQFFVARRTLPDFFKGICQSLNSARSDDNFSCWTRGIFVTNPGIQCEEKSAQQEKV